MSAKSFNNYTFSPRDLMANICNFCGSTKPNVDGLLQTDLNLDSTFLEMAATHFWFSEDELKSFCICHLCREKLLAFHQFYCQVQMLYAPKADAIKVENIPNKTDENDIEIEPLNIKTEVDSSGEDGKVGQPDMDEVQDDRPPHLLIKNKDIRLFCDMKCPFCSEQFDTFDLLRVHCRLVHKQKSYVTCCNSQFSIYSKLQEHILAHIDPNCFRCKLCDSNLRSMRNLIRHQNTVHPNDGEKTYDCELCTEKFSARYLLNDHITIIHSSDKKFECPHCLKRFINSKQVTYHIRYKHTNGEQLKCEVCSKVCTGKSNLERHRSLHSSTRVNCPICERSLKNEWTLQKHLKSHREATMNIKCSFCDKSSPNLHALRQHVKAAHTEQKRRYQCPSCDKTFNRTFCLKVHMTVHTGELPYSCDVCAKPFRTAANLYGHRKVHHPEEFRKQKVQKLMPVKEEVLTE